VRSKSPSPLNLPGAPKMHSSRSVGVDRLDVGHVTVTEIRNGSNGGRGIDAVAKGFRMSLPINGVAPNAAGVWHPVREPEAGGSGVPRIAVHPPGDEVGAFADIKVGI